VTVTVWLSSGGEDVEGVMQGGCDGSLRHKPNIEILWVENGSRA
jgi:hypothetical protein